MPVLLGAVGLASPAHALAVRDAGYLSLVEHPSFASARIYDEVRYLGPSLAPATKVLHLIAAGIRYPVRWNDQYPATHLSLAAALREVTQRVSAQRASAPGGVYVDRALTASERARFTIVADLYRDADVLVVSSGHPACAGLSRAQARAIASGRVSRWSQVVAGARADAIRVRHLGSPHLGTGRVRRNVASLAYARGAVQSPDGGVSAAAGGDQSIAAITTWARMRGRLAGVCAVPLNGVAPSDASVSALRYAEAFPVRYLVPRAQPRHPLQRTIRRVFAQHLRSARVKAMLRGSGLLVAGETPPLPSGSAPTRPASPAPTVDHAGRPITTSSADVAPVLTGLRLDTAQGDGTSRLALEPAGALRQLHLGADGSCVKTGEGGWTVKGGWRYVEHGGGLVARVGWFLGPGASERVVDLPDAEPAAGYLDGAAYRRAAGAPADCPAPAFVTGMPGPA
jgi:hypothetical protein